MKNLTIIFALLALTFSLKAQSTPPSIQWQKCYGGSTNDEATSIQQTIDGGFIVAGHSQSNDGDVTFHWGSTFYKDYWIVKLDTLGSIQWQKSLGGTNDDIFPTLRQTNDGGYIVVGRSMSNDGDATFNNGIFDYWMVKLDTVGNIQWQKSLGGTDDELAYSIEQTNDGGYIVAGNTDSNNGDVTGLHAVGSTDYWIVKLDTVGNIQWQKCLGGTNYDYGRSIQQTNDGGYIVAGSSTSNDGDVTGHYGTIMNNDYWIVKLDTVGNIQWQKCLGGTNTEAAESIKQTSDGGYIVAGKTDSQNGDVTGLHNAAPDIWIVKLDTVGNIQWQKCLGGTNNEGAYSIQQTNDGGYIVAGRSFSNDGDITGHHGSTIYLDYWVIKLDTSGNLQWQKSLGGTDDDVATSIQQTNDGGFIIAGRALSNNGDVTYNHGYFDYWVVKLGPAPLSIKEQKNTSNVSIYPNPSDGVFKVNVPSGTKYIEISNSLGQVLEKSFVVHQTQLNFNIKENGVYIVQIVTDKETITKKDNN